jgi:ABC-type multidrug transport system ATPase subunit
MAIISTENLTKYYRNKNKTVKALDDISIRINDNQIVGLLGQNGSGKTTFIKSCTNLITYEGKIYYGDEFISKKKHINIIVPY